MQVNLFFDWLSNGELLTLKTGPPCIAICIGWSKKDFKGYKLIYLKYIIWSTDFRWRNFKNI